VTFLFTQSEKTTLNLSTHYVEMKVGITAENVLREYIITNQKAVLLLQSTENELDTFFPSVTGKLDGLDC